MKGKRNTVNRLLRNKGAFFGLVVICAALTIAVIAYFIAPDRSPDANRIIVEIGGRKPGFSQLFLLVRKQQQPPSVSFFRQLLDGREDAFDYLPINSYIVRGDSLIVEKFIDEGCGGKTLVPAEAGTRKNPDLLARDRQIRPRHSKPLTDWR